MADLTLQQQLLVAIVGGVVSGGGTSLIVYSSYTQDVQRREERNRLLDSEALTKTLADSRRGHSSLENIEQVSERVRRISGWDLRLTRGIDTTAREVAAALEDLDRISPLERSIQKLAPLVGEPNELPRILDKAGWISLKGHLYVDVVTHPELRAIAVRGGESQLGLPISLDDDRAGAETTVAQFSHYSLEPAVEQALATAREQLGRIEAEKATLIADVSEIAGRRVGSLGEAITTAQAAMKERGARLRRSQRQHLLRVLKFNRYLSRRLSTMPGPTRLYRWWGRLH